MRDGIVSCERCARLRQYCTRVAREGVVRATRSPDEIRIPDTIGELRGARIDRLSPAAKRVAQVASVLGRQFHASQQLVRIRASRNAN